MPRNASSDLLCPSAPAEVGALIIGVVGADGTVAYIHDRLSVTSEFLEVANKNGVPEKRFRFGSLCRQQACAQWVEGGCSLPHRLSELIPSGESAGRLPRCAIRAQCRWFAQSGARSCRFCPIVTTRA